jgi:2,3-bisphosphoglycerate-independent phosphoglycerate mutase
MTETKWFLLICDGMGDRPVPELGYRTPLEAAETPNLDDLARRGINGIVDPIAPGVRPGSDTSHLAYLGCDPFECYSGRGPMEAAGIGMDVKPGDVAFRCNFSTVDERMVVVDRRAGRITEGTHELAAAIAGRKIEGVEVIFKESVAHRGALILRGEGLGSNVTDVDPHEEGETVHECRALDEGSEKTARVVNQLVRTSHEILGAHPLNVKRKEEGLLPANILLPRGAGIMKPLKSFRERYGIKGAAIAEVGLIYGVANIVGLDLVEVPTSTGGLDTDLEDMVSHAIRALDDHEFIMMNIKGCDIAGHDGDAEAKRDFIQRIDQVLPKLTDSLEEGTYLVVTADHSTPVTIKDHSGDPVPVCITGEGVRTDAVQEYGERSCARGDLGRIRGMDLVTIMMDLMDRAEKFGA